MGFIKGGPSARWARGLVKWRSAFERIQQASASDEAERYAIGEEITLLDLMLEKEISEAESGDCASYRADVRRIAQELQDLLEGGKSGDAALKALVELANSGAKESAVRASLREHTERLARLKLTAQDSETRKDEVVTRKQAVAVFQVWLGLLRVELDPQVFARLAPRLLHVTEGIGIEDGKT